MNNTTTSAPIFAKQVLPAVLRLTLTKKWYDMILSGEKKEEYREYKQYWIDRLMAHKTLPKNEYRKIVAGTTKTMAEVWSKNFDLIEFKNGYAKSAPSMIVECKGISFGKARPEWSEGFADDCFIISLGNVVSSTA